MRWAPVMAAVGVLLLLAGCAERGQKPEIAPAPHKVRKHVRHSPHAVVRPAPAPVIQAPPAAPAVPVIVSSPPPTIAAPSAPIVTKPHPGRLQRAWEWLKAH